jgi:hypothetical protein
MKFILLKCSIAVQTIKSLILPSFGNNDDTFHWLLNDQPSTSLVCAGVVGDMTKHAWPPTLLFGACV